MLPSGFDEESLYEDAEDKRILLQMNELERTEILASRYEKKRAAERALKSCAYVKKQKLTHVPAYTFRPARNPAADSAYGPTPASSSTPSRKVSNSLTASRKNATPPKAIDLLLSESARKEAAPPKAIDLLAEAIDLLSERDHSLGANLEFDSSLAFAFPFPKPGPYLMPIGYSKNSWYQIRLSTDDLQRLEVPYDEKVPDISKYMLNDTLFDWWLLWFSFKHFRESTYVLDSTLIFNVYTITKLKLRKVVTYADTESLRRWIDKLTRSDSKSVFDYSTLVIPIYGSIHWSCLVVENPGMLASMTTTSPTTNPAITPSVKHFDSCPGIHLKDEYCDALVTILATVKCQLQDGDERDFRKMCVSIKRTVKNSYYPQKTHRQVNQYDCGFHCIYQLQEYFKHYSPIYRNEVTYNWMGHHDDGNAVAAEVLQIRKMMHGHAMGLKYKFAVLQRSNDQFYDGSTKHSSKGHLASMGGVYPTYLAIQTPLGDDSSHSLNTLPSSQISFLASPGDGGARDHSGSLVSTASGPAHHAEMLSISPGDGGARDHSGLLVSKASGPAHHVEMLSISPGDGGARDHSGSLVSTASGPAHHAEMLSISPGDGGARDISYLLLEEDRPTLSHNSVTGLVEPVAEGQLTPRSEEAVIVGSVPGGHQHMHRPDKVRLPRPPNGYLDSTYLLSGLPISEPCRAAVDISKYHPHAAVIISDPSGLRPFLLSRITENSGRHAIVFEGNEEGRHRHCRAVKHWSELIENPTHHSYPTAVGLAIRFVIASLGKFGLAPCARYINSGTLRRGTSYGFCISQASSSKRTPTVYTFSCLPFPYKKGNVNQCPFKVLIRERVVTDLDDKTVVYAELFTSKLDHLGH